MDQITSRAADESKGTESRPKRKVELSHLRDKIDLAAAREFLSEISQDQDDVQFCFQWFDDNKEKGAPGYISTIRAGHISGTFEECAEQLVTLNLEGAGIYVCINRTDGGGRLETNVTSLRAAFVDSDNGPLPELKLKPSIIVSSKNGEHAYFLLEKRECLERFKPLQKTLIAHLGTDKAVCDLPRVLRLPGFFHLKDPENPFLVTTKFTSPVRYTIDQILDIYPPVKIQSAAQPRRLKTKTHTNVSQFHKWTEQLPTDEGNHNSLGGRSKTLVLLVREALGLGIIESEIRIAVQTYCEKSGFSESEGMKIISSQMKSHERSPFTPFFNGKPDAYELAKEFIKRRFAPLDGNPTAWKYMGDYFLYRENRYATTKPDDFKSEVTGWLQKETSFEPKINLVSNICMNVDALIRLDSLQDLNSWIGKPPSNATWVPVKNGLLEISTTTVKLHPFNPRYFSVNCLPYSFDPEAKCPQWLAFLSEAVADEATRNFLQEWFGYNLIADASFAKFVLLTGEGANGKSVICTVLTEMLGTENVSSVGLEAFNPNRTFMLAHTVGKLANIVEELNEVTKTAEGMLKTFVVGGSMTVERKNRDPFNFKPHARITFATNILPHFTDRSDGLWRRMILITMSFTILDESKQNRNLVKGDWWCESGELPGVLNWAIAGLHRLLKRGRFIEPNISVEAKAAFKLESNPAKDFLREYCIEDERAETSANDLYQKYNSCMLSEGRKPLNATQFAREIKRVFQKAAKSEHARTTPTDRTRVWKGFKMAPQIEIDENRF